MKPFPYPLTEECLRAFRHPRTGHCMHHPARLGRDIVAGNGYLAIRAQKGRWLDEEFPAIGAEFRRRLERLPWARCEAAATRPEWRALDDIRGTLRAAPQAALWLGDKPAPSPVWRVGGQFLIRLSHLLLIARLPRCEVFIAPQDRSAALLFRFSGGHGMVAPDSRLTIASREVFAPRVDCLDGHTTPDLPHKTTWRPTQFSNWPPPEPQD